MSIYVLLALAVSPGMAIAIYIYWQDKFEREPRKLLFWAFFLGMVSVLPAILLEAHWGSLGFATSPIFKETAFFAFVVVGFSEELSKFFLLRYFLYRRKAFNEPFDGITYAVMVSMGFATVENVMYVIEGGFHVAIMRAIFAVPAHATFGIIMGYFVGLAKFRSAHRTLFLILGLLGATIFHGLYDLSLMQSNIPYLKIPGAVLSLVVAGALSISAIRIHQKRSPFQ